MTMTLNHSETKRLNELIEDVLHCDSIKEVHLFELSWLLQLDPIETDRWMHQHAFGRWMTGRDPNWWRAI